MTFKAIYDKLIVETTRRHINPIDKGKPFERMGPRRRLIATPGQPKLNAKAIQRRLDKTLEPKSPKRLMAVSCQKGKGCKV